MTASTIPNVVPAGQAYYVAATGTSQYVTVTSTNGSISSIYVENLDSTNDIFVNAQVTATAPTTGNPQTGVAVQNGVGRSIYVCSPNQNVTQANVAVVTFTSTANVVITPIC
jgi:hypothetical protein